MNSHNQPLKLLQTVLLFAVTQREESKVCLAGERLTDLTQPFVLPESSRVARLNVRFLPDNIIRSYLIKLGANAAKVGASMSMSLTKWRRISPYKALFDWGAHASRVLARASSLARTFGKYPKRNEVRRRETRALPGSFRFSHANIFPRVQAIAPTMIDSRCTIE